MSKASTVGNVPGDGVANPPQDAAGAGTIVVLAGDEALDDGDDSGLEEGDPEKTGPGVCGCLLILVPICLIIWVVVIWLVIRGFR